MKAGKNSILFFGKLPAFGDFIRYNASGPLVRGFENWIQEGLYKTSQHFDQDWDEVYKCASSYQFLQHYDSTDYFLTGILHPSYDKGERKYPFIISCCKQKKMLASEFSYLIPLVFSQFYTISFQLIRESMGGMPLEEIIARVEDLSELNFCDAEYCEKNFHHYLSSTTLEDFFLSLFGEFESPKKFLLFKNLFEILQPFSSWDPSSSSLGIRFPLSNQPSLKNKEVSFWIKICVSILKNSSFSPNIFWEVERNRRRNFLFLFFREPLSKNFIQLIKPELEDDTICQLEEDGGEKNSNAAEGISPKYRTALENKDLALADFLSLL